MIGPRIRDVNNCLPVKRLRDCKKRLVRFDPSFIGQMPLALLLLKLVGLRFCLVHIIESILRCRYGGCGAHSHY